MSSKTELVVRCDHMIKIKTINNYKLLARLFKLQQIQKEQEEYKLAIDLVLTNFKLKYPDINMDDLKEVYTINIDNGIDLEIRHYNHSEYEKPYMDGYKELLDLQLLCNKHFRSEFRTMVGEKFWSIKDYKEYEVLYIQEEYKAEQMFLLINIECNKEVIVKVNEWRCGHLAREGDFYSSKELMLECLSKKYTNEHIANMERIERIRKIK